MSGANIVVGVIIVYIFIYTIVQIMKFYGVPLSTYAIYLTFFTFIVVSGFILPARIGE